MTGAYAGIGARGTPLEIRDLMRDVAYHLGQSGWTLRTGGAPGADQAFYVGGMQATGGVELFLPWATFEIERLQGWGQPTLQLPYPHSAAYEIGERFHPAWKALTATQRSLHARNAHEVLGASLRDPCRFVICWTPGATGRGGTGQALRIARHYGVPIFDLARAADRERIRVFCSRHAEVVL